MSDDANTADDCSTDTQPAGRSDRGPSPEPDPDPADPNDEVLVQRGPTTTKYVYHLNRDGSTNCDRVGDADVEARLRYKLPGRFTCCQYCHPAIDIDRSSKTTSLRQRIANDEVDGDDLRADGGQLESASNEQPDGRRTDGQHATTGYAGFKTTDLDQSRLDALASEFGNDTLALRNAVRIACEELGLEPKHELEDDDLRCDGGRNVHASRVNQLKTAAENGTAPEGMDMTVAHDCPKWPDRATVSIPIDESCEACGWTPGDDGGDR